LPSSFLSSSRPQTWTGYTSCRQKWRHRFSESVVPFSTGAWWEFVLLGKFEQYNVI
jgi:hypothetical protein